MKTRSISLMMRLLLGLLVSVSATLQVSGVENLQEKSVDTPRAPQGLWTGSISIMGSELNILVTFTAKSDSISASIDIPQQMALGLPLKNVSWRPPRIHFELPAGPGLAVFDGTAWKDSMAGDFTQGGIRGTFTLRRNEEAAQPAKAKPEEPPPPYREEEVKFSSDTVTISGTLTIPTGRGPHPAVILITGSGAHNRDEELFGFKPFRVMADYFTRHGLAVLRCDDRGVGGSTGSKPGSTSADHAADVLASVGYLRKRPDVIANQIGLCGHSEGGLIAPLAASRSPGIAFIVLIAGPSVPGDRLILFQLESLMRSGGADESQIASTLAQQERAFVCVRTGNGWDSLAAEMRGEVAASIASMTPEQRKAFPDSAAFVNANVNHRLSAARSPWFRYFIDCDPLPALEYVRCPVLALFGELDMQVPVGLNKEPMEKALGRSSSKDWRVEVIPKANHLFQKAVTGNPSEYATLEKSFVAGFLDLMTGWMLKRVPVSR